MNEGRSSAEPVVIVCVCTGNICRSPAAEQLLAQALGPGARVTSVGTRALVGAPVAAPMRQLLGPDPRGVDFRARQLRPRLIDEADLVLTMADEHTGVVVEEAPRAVRRTFRLKELAWLLRDVPPSGLGPAGLLDRVQAGTVAAAARRRPTSLSGSFDVVDPYGRDAASYRRAFDEIEEAVGALVSVLQPRTLAGGSS